MKSSSLQTGLLDSAHDHFAVQRKRDREREGGKEGERRKEGGREREREKEGRREREGEREREGGKEGERERERRKEGEREGERRKEGERERRREGGRERERERRKEGERREWYFSKSTWSLPELNTWKLGVTQYLHHPWADSQPLSLIPRPVSRLPWHHIQRLHVHVVRSWLYSGALATHVCVHPISSYSRKIV